MICGAFSMQQPMGSLTTGKPCLDCRGALPGALSVVTLPCTCITGMASVLDRIVKGQQAVDLSHVLCVCSCDVYKLCRQQPLSGSRCCRQPFVTPPHCNSCAGFMHPRAAMLKGGAERVSTLALCLSVSCLQVLLLNGSHDRETSTCGSHCDAMRASDVVMAVTDALNRRRSRPVNTQQPESKVCRRGAAWRSPCRVVRDFDRPSLPGK